MFDWDYLLKMAGRQFLGRPYRGWTWYHLGFKVNAPHPTLHPLIGLKSYPELCSHWFPGFGRAGDVIN